MTAVGDLDYARFTIDIDPDDTAKQEVTSKTAQIAIAGISTLFPIAKYTQGIQFLTIDTGAGSGGGTTRKLQMIAIARRTVT